MTWATVNASMVEVIPKRTSSAIHPDALGVDVAADLRADMSADYRQQVEVIEQWVRGGKLP
jgi:hypothetical protein